MEFVGEVIPVTMEKKMGDETGERRQQTVPDRAPFCCK